MSSVIGQPGRLDIERHDRSSAVVLVLRGDVDMVTAPTFEAAAARELAQGPSMLVLDMTAVEFLASAGLSVLVSLYQRTAENGVLRIVATSRAVLRPLEVMALVRYLPLYPTLEAALGPG